MEKKKLIVIGIQHSGTRYVCNLLTKHKNISFFYHISVPSGDIFNPFDDKYSINENIIKNKEDVIVVFVHREKKSILGSNDNALVMKQINQIQKKENLTNLFVDYKNQVDNIINNILEINNIPYTFFSLETYELYRKHYLKSFINDNLKLSYDDYPKNLSGRYHFCKQNEKLEDVKNLKEAESYCYLDIEIHNTNRKYYDYELKYWDFDGNLLV